MSEPGERNEINDIVEALYRLKIAVESLNPDPMQTIAEYRRAQRQRAFWTTYGAIVGTIALLVSVGQLVAPALGLR